MRGHTLHITPVTTGPGADKEEYRPVSLPLFISKLLILGDQFACMKQRQKGLKDFYGLLYTLK